MTGCDFNVEQNHLFFNYLLGDEIDDKLWFFLKLCQR